jgi:hypothetical protein
MRARGVAGGGRRLAIVALGCSLGACGLSLTGVGSDEAASARDGGTEAAPSRDAASDHDDARAPGQRFCASLSPAPTFCDEFDTEAANIGDGWDSIVGAPRRTTSVSMSFPGALDAVSDAGSPTLLRKAFKVNSSIRVDLDVRYAGIPPSPGALTPFVIRPANDGEGYFYLYAESGRSYLQVANDEYSTWQTPEPAAGIWHHVSASVTIDASGTKFAGALDFVAYAWSSPTKHGWAAGTTATVEVGVTPYQANGEILVDNVVVNVE